MKYDLVAIGNALVDFEARVDEEFIRQFSLSKGGMSLVTAEEQARVLKVLQGKKVKTCSGGSAANTVHGVSVLGGNGYYFGKIGDDPSGRIYEADMFECRVGFPGREGAKKTDTTGTCIVLITPDSERTMLTHLGISASLHADNIDPQIVEKAKCVYIEGYLWTGDDTRSAAMKVAKIAREKKIPVAFTLSDAFVVNHHKESLNEFIHDYVNILFCNTVEARALTDASNPEDAFDDLVQRAEALFLTLGADGAYVGKKGGERKFVKAFRVQAIDTTGAGDLFAAGVLYSLVNKRGMIEAGAIGSYCAAQVVTHMGARMPVKSHTDIDKILQEYKEL
ncbi:MAG: adenosine kinase [Nitrospinae bacterium CG11_big_fil_rev_8_21_14_0_20_45_15]|nr:MAG: adenosine kinase [Nitrospinae bacterium CG11_big_fil_rev_8_21_14_0_20_45_15]